MKLRTSPARVLWTFFLLVAAAPRSIAALREPANSPAHPSSAVAPCAPARDLAAADGERLAVTCTTSEQGARCRALAQRIGGLLDEEWIGELSDDGEKRLESFLVNLLLDGGLLEDALQTLTDLGGNCDQWLVAGWRLQKGGQAALAGRAFREAALREPDSHWAFEGLEAVDLAGALELLDRKPEWFARLSVGDAAVRRARVLVRWERKPEAIAVLRAALTAKDLGEDFWEYFLELEPELAQAELERYLRTSSNEVLPGLYADLLDGQDDGGLACDFLSSQVIEQGTSWSLVWRLVELDPRRALEALEARVARAPQDLQGWSRLGDVYLDFGRFEDALDAWQRAFELDFAESERTEELWIHRRGPFFAAYEAALRSCTDGYPWGCYGDYLWRSGRNADAVEAWAAALALDPDDADWSARLERVRAGLWPL